ncbi:MAG: SCP2 domain-containing protein [[Pasteurella] mairii]|uniref:Ubiquinone biosynthesis accessory factor UbiJ n=1 Tax=[Pasteurella] mairii TaxID=757 RepID=A0A379B1Z8_9PAST|nr:SCP2 domain-containing protein [[Pasteurella] mairii]SUB32531.1 protein YigP [[Pasteurella] mairii]
MLPRFEQLKMQLMLPQLLHGGLETIINYLLQKTPNASLYLRKLNGKVLAVNAQKFNFPIYFIFSSQRIDLLHQYEGEADCEVSIALSVLLNMPKKAKLSQYINDQSILLQGDLQVLQDVVALMEFVEKDPAELLSRYIGDVPAHSAVSFLQDFVATLKQKLGQSQQYWGERLTEEWQVVSPSLAIADFCEQVKTLEKDTALFEQKLAKLPLS